jgi:16S rRNA (uracil1498-N3)-methyltransferase
MSISRIYQPSELAIGGEVTLDEAASHHLSRVLRAAIGDTVTLFNGLGGEYSAKIIQITKRHVVARLVSFSPREAESELNLCLAQGIARGEKMDYIIQKAVELGVKEIIPLLTERTTVKLDQGRSEKRLSHWQAIAISAAEQCGRNYVPPIAPPCTFSQALLTTAGDIRFVLSPRSSQKLDKSNGYMHKRIVLWIGPEGGFSESEMDIALSSGCLALNLGPRILRTETASLAAITLLQSQLGDMG